MDPLDVIWIDDDIIRPPGPKMVVCLEPFMGFFCRINSHDNWKPCVPIIRVPDHTFLRHDSFLECRLLTIDDYIIEESLRRGGQVGRLSATLCQPILDALGGAGLSSNDRRDIRATLEPLIP